MALTKSARPDPTKGRTHWPLQDAKTHFSELVRTAHERGPQRVTVRGRDAVVVVDATEFDRMQSPVSGREIYEALLNSPHKDVSLERVPVKSKVRDVNL